MKKKAKIIVTSVSLAAIIGVPGAVLAYGKNEIYTMFDQGDRAQTRNSYISVVDGDMNLNLEPTTWGDEQYKKEVIVDGSFKIKNTSKAYSQRVYASKAKFYAYRDGAVYYTFSELNTKYKMKDFTIKPGKSSKEMYAEFIRTSKGFSKTKAEYYCLHVPVKEGSKGKEHSVGMCTDNYWFKK